MAHHAHKHNPVQVKQYFDFVTYINNLKKVGVTQEVAEVQGLALENLSEKVINQFQFLVTKEDLKATNIEIAQIQNRVGKIEEEMLDIRGEIKEIHHETATIRKDMGYMENNLRKDMNLMQICLQKDMIEMQSNLKLEIKNNTLRLFAMMSTLTGAMLAVMAKGFHWI